MPLNVASEVGGFGIGGLIVGRPGIHTVSFVSFFVTQRSSADIHLAHVFSFQIMSSTSCSNYVETLFCLSVCPNYLLFYRFINYHSRKKSVWIVQFSSSRYEWGVGIRQARKRFCGQINVRNYGLNQASKAS